MPEPLQTIIQRMVAANEPEDAIASVIKQYKATPSTSVAAPATPGVPSQASLIAGRERLDAANRTPLQAEQPDERTWTDTAVDLLPAAGGIVGGVLGGGAGAVAGGVGAVPGGIGGAALGGGAGEAAKQLVNRMRGKATPATMGAAAADIGIQGGIQGVGQAAGAGIAKVASTASPWLMNRALNLTDKLSREFPQLSTTMIDHALTVSKGGLSKARGMLTAAKGEANAALQAAHAQGATVPIDAATAGLNKTLSKVMAGEDIEGGLATLAAIEKKVIGGRSGALTPIEADALKTNLQTQSKALYTAQKMGQGRPNTTIKAQALADMAASLNEGIGTITTAAGAPGYRAANAAAAEMIGAVRGIEKGIRPGANLYQAMVRPGVGAIAGGVLGGQTNGTAGVGMGALIGGALTSPAGMSRLAVALAKPGVKVILKGAPKLAAAVASFLASDSSEEGQ